MTNQEELDQKIQINKSRRISLETALIKNSILIYSKREHPLLTKRLKKCGYMVFYANDVKNFMHFINTIKIQNMIIDLNVQGVEIIKNYEIIRDDNKYNLKDNSVLISEDHNIIKIIEDHLENECAKYEEYCIDASNEN